jgi:hypothetical protein
MNTTLTVASWSCRPDALRPGDARVLPRGAAASAARPRGGVTVSQPASSRPVYLRLPTHPTSGRICTVPDFLDEKRKEINDRLAVLKPAVDEYGRLQDAASALAKVSGSAPAATAATRATKAATAAPTTKRRSVRRKRTGGRARQALALIRAEPGIATPSLAERMGVKANYLYRILPPLEQAGRIEKQGRGWRPTALAA